MGCSLMKTQHYRGLISSSPIKFSSWKLEKNLFLLSAAGGEKKIEIHPEPLLFLTEVCHQRKPFYHSLFDMGKEIYWTLAFLAFLSHLKKGRQESKEHFWKSWSMHLGLYKPFFLYLIIELENVSSLLISYHYINRAPV